jgi:hypothetical protein
VSPVIEFNRGTLAGLTAGVVVFLTAILSGGAYFLSLGLALGFIIGMLLAGRMIRIGGIRLFEFGGLAMFSLFYAILFWVLLLFALIAVAGNGSTSFLIAFANIVAVSAISGIIAGALLPKVFPNWPRRMYFGGAFGASFMVVAIMSLFVMCWLGCLTG